MSAFLASVRSVEEAKIALQHADIIDLKEPSNGALGALPLDTIEDIVRFVDGRKLVSATVGDLPMQSEVMAHAVEATAATGVDIVKVGFLHFDGSCMRALGQLAGRIKLVAVLFADAQADFGLTPKLAQAGFYGLMLDTLQKQGASLNDYMTLEQLEHFLAQARSYRLMTGLAGSLQAKDVVTLAPLAADYLGFRGALCDENQRQNSFNLSRVVTIKKMLQKYNAETPEVVV